MIGKVHARVLPLVSNSILLADVTPGDALGGAGTRCREADGCVRFSWLPVTARVPRRYRCQPQTSGRTGAALQSLRYGTAVYGQLSPATHATRSAAAPTTRARWARSITFCVAAARDQPAAPPRRVPARRPRSWRLLRDPDEEHDECRYSRFTFDAWNDFLGVLMQQGRVQLDADWNELVSQMVRRLQAGTLDTFGPAVVPRDDAGRVPIDAAGGALTIGVGRMYVDGLLAENHGAGDRGLGPAPRRAASGRDRVDYTAQPYYPEAPALPGGGPHLVYLDVWQREVTHLQQPDLVEKAVGVDTTGRCRRCGRSSCSRASAARNARRRTGKFPAGPN